MSAARSDWMRGSRSAVSARLGKTDMKEATTTAGRRPREVEDIGDIRGWLNLKGLFGRHQFDMIDLQTGVFLDREGI